MLIESPVIEANIKEDKMSRINDYYKLLEYSYDEVVEYLLNKYGAVSDDYFRENSYKRFLKGEIKNITKGKFSRGKEGLYTHHIDEYIIIKLSDSYFLKQHRIPFKYQKKERLVYCDLIEHAILHVLIEKETDGKATILDNGTKLIHESGGYAAFISPIIEEWYVKKRVPTRPWMIKSYNRAYLTVSEACEILNYMDQVAGYRNPFPKTVEEYYERKRLQEKERVEAINRINEREREYYEELKESARRLHEKSPRDEILTKLYQFKIKEDKIDYKKFKSEMSKYFKEELIEQLHVYL